MESQRSLVHLVCKYVALIQPLLPLLLLHPQSTSLVKSQLELTSLGRRDRRRRLVSNFGFSVSEPRMSKSFFFHLSTYKNWIERISRVSRISHEPTVMGFQDHVPEQIRASRLNSTWLLTWSTVMMSCFFKKERALEMDEIFKSLVEWVSWPTDRWTLNK